MRTEEELFRRCFVEKTWRLIRRNLEGQVLDVGASDGLLVAHHSGSIGLDVKPQESYVPLVVADMHQLPFKEEAFDTVTMCHVLEHTSKPNILLREVKRVLRTNGKFIVAIPNAKATMAVLLHLTLGHDGYAFPRRTVREHWRHEIFLGFEDLRSMLEEASFQIDASYGSTPHLPFLERIFDHGILRRIYGKLGDIDKENAKDIIFVCRKPLPPASLSSSRKSRDSFFFSENAPIALAEPEQQWDSRTRLHELPRRIALYAPTGDTYFCAGFPFLPR